MNLLDNTLFEEKADNSDLERGHLTVYFFHEDSFVAQRLIQVLVQIGIQPKYFSNSDDLLSMARLEPPHFVITSLHFSTKNSVLEGAATDKIEFFFERLKEISHEIFSFVLVPLELIPFIIQNKESFNLSDYSTLTLDSLSEFAFRIEQASHKVMTYFTSSQEKDPTPLVGGDKLSEERIKEKKLLLEVSHFSSLSLECKDKDQLVKTFMIFTSKITKNKPVLFLRYIENKNSYAIHQSHWIDIEKFRGVGFVQTEESMHDSLKTLMERVFFQKRYSAISLNAEGKIQGIFVIFDDLKEEIVRDAISLGEIIVNQQYKIMSLMLRNHRLEIQDELAPIFKKDYLFEQIESEILRSRRISKPLSLFVLEIDQINALQTMLTPVQTLRFMKVFSKLLVRSGRVHDIAGRVGPNTFAVLLSHTDIGGAVIKASRLCSILRSTRFKILRDVDTSMVTISIGVSEYPSMCLDSDALFRLADNALHLAKSNGGDQFIRAKPPAGFVPDFNPVTLRQELREGR